MNGLASATKILSKEFFTSKLFCGAKQTILVLNKGRLIHFSFKEIIASINLLITTLNYCFLKNNVINDLTLFYTEVTLIINYKNRLLNNGNLVPDFNSFSIAV